MKFRIIQITADRLGCFCCRRAGLGCAQIAKHQLGQFVRLTFVPDAVDVIHTHIDLAGRVIRQIGIDDALVESQLSSVRGDAEHIVHAGIHRTGMDFGSALGQLLHHRLLNLCRLCHHIVIDSLRHRKVKLVRCLDIGHFFEQSHQLRQIEELGKARSGTVAGTFRCQLNRRRSFTEGGSPAVKMSQTFLLKRVMLEIAHHGVKLGHGIADGRTRCEHHSLAAGQLIDVAAFQQHIRRFLRIRCRESGHISHLCIEKQVLEGVCLVHIEPVNAQFLKGNDIILSSGFQQFFQLGFQSFLRALHGLDGKALRTAVFQFFNTLGDFLNLFPQQPLLPFHGNGNPLKLTVPDDNGVIIAGGDARAELFAVFQLKVLFRCRQNVGRRVQPQKLRSPLLGQMIRNHKHRLVAKPQTLALHGGSDHLEGLACAHLVRQQRISAIENVCDGVQLMLP